jgi:spermidine/putrescine-binding protein
MAQAETALFSQRPDLRAMPKKALAKNADYRRAMEAGWQAGMAELVKIAANARYFTDSSTLVPMDVSRGETAAGIAIDFYAQVTEESVGSGRMRYIAPIGATAITPDPVAVLAGASGRKLELAQHFIEFLLSPQGQRLWILKPGTPGGPLERSLRRPPIRQDVYADRTGWVDGTDPFTSAAGFNERGEWMALFDDTRPMWVAAWIDSREELQDAYRKVLAVPEINRRAALIDTLAYLPIKMADVEAMKAEAARVPDVSYWRAKKQIEWAETFRRHYRQVGEEAE